MTATANDTQTGVAETVLEVRDLDVRYYTGGGVVRAVDGVSFTLSKGERFGLVGESGSGKTTMGLALIGAVKRPGRVERGRVIWELPTAGLSQSSRNIAKRTDRSGQGIFDALMSRLDS